MYASVRAVACLGVLLHIGIAEAGPRVRVDSGWLEGVESAGVAAYKGIPYAAAPVGPNRWRAPQPLAPWSGVRPAREYGNDCVQLPIPGDAGASGSTRAEDCLVLNVWTPARRARGERLPVMVWLHGGGFLNGAASVPFFDGSEFARAGVVLVGLNYRLGRLGFFAHPEITAANDRPLANYALLDQRAALRWVQRNIAAFGGDPAKVTIFGESAGGISVMHLLTWPDARGLFHRAAVLSGGGRTFLVPSPRLAEPAGALPSAESTGLALASERGITATGPAQLAALRALSAEQVNGEMSMAALVKLPASYAGGPIHDGDIVTALPGEHLLRGNFARVPLLIGTTGQDLPADLPPNPADPLAFFGADRDRARALYDPAGALGPLQLTALVGIDLSMHEPARFVARQFTASGQPAWLYRFEYVVEAERKQFASAQHAGELPFLFDQLDARYGSAVTPADRAMARTFHRYFVNFAKHGDPNGDGLPSWPRFKPDSFDLQRFTGGGDAVFGRDPWAERLELLERAIAREAQPSREPVADR